MRKSHQIADRMKHLDASGIRKVFDLAARMKDPVNFSIGQPDFDVPDSLKQIAIDAIRRGHNKYTQTQGTAELLKALGELCCKEFGWHDPNRGATFGERGYLVTSGTSGGLMLAILTLVNPGDEVVFTDPYFVMYRHLVNLAGGVPVPVSTYPSFRLDAQKLADAITDKTRLLILNSPCNPSGAVYSREEMKAVAEVAAKHDLLIVSDEIYQPFCYDRPFVSLVEVYDNTLLLRGFSKSHAMTGWRVGWCTGPKAIIEKMTMLQQYSFVCAPSFAQDACVAALATDMSREAAAYKRKRDMVFDALGPAFGLVKPEGAFYAFVPAPGGDATAFVQKAIANNVLIIPGNVFSDRDTHFRLSYATTDDKIRQGLDILVRIAKQ
jgi:aspartate aminotransferase